MPFHYSKLFPETVGASGCEVKSYKVSAWKQCKLFKSAYNPFRNGIIKKYLKIPDKLFAVSAALKQALEDNGIGNVEVLYNGIDTEKWNVEPVGHEPAHFIFFGGRLSAVKGGDVLLQAVTEINKKDVRVLAVGTENDYVRKLKEKVGQFLLVEGNHSHGEMKNVYARVTMVAAPSLCFDWLPTVVLEAMATRKPVIATCFGGSKEMVVDGKTGFIVNPHNPDELKQKIQILLDNPKLALEMVALGYERVRSEFSVEKQIETLLGWYNKSLSK